MKRYSDLNLFTIHLVFCIIHLLPRKGLYQFETHCDIETWHHDHVWQAMTVMSRRTFAIFLSVSVSVTQYHPTVTVQYCVVHSPLSYSVLSRTLYSTVLHYIINRLRARSDEQRFVSFLSGRSKQRLGSANQSPMTDPNHSSSTTTTSLGSHALRQASPRSSLITPPQSFLSGPLIFSFNFSHLPSLRQSLLTILPHLKKKGRQDIHTTRTHRMSTTACRTCTISFSSLLLVFVILLSGHHHPTLAFSSIPKPSSSASSLSSATRATHFKMTSAGDTPTTLPDFATSEEYLEYMSTVSALPKGFATGTADGTFISAEAPGLGYLKIRATVIHLTEGPTDNWAACYTSNKVREGCVGFLKPISSLWVFAIQR